ncbi:MAG TPA: hypothetical protein VMY38_08530 [Gemmatimonadaceae bacterium]|nr:hypothetical protein [Gemmatimonadaceae bacterium]
MSDNMMDDARLRALKAMADRLPREIEPPAEAWDAVRAQIERDGAAGRAPGDVAFWQRPGFLIAASLLLAAGSSTATFLALRDREARPGTVAQSAGPAPVAAAGTVSTLAQFSGKENDYLRRVNGLVAILESGNAALAPETILKVRESLAIIDAAILEARAALARDPANRELIEMLESTYEKKLDLLQRTTEMARS